MEGEESNQSIPTSVMPLEDASASKRAKVDQSDSDRLLNFATAADEFDFNLKRGKMPRDPMSHRIIEKRRRDRMNNCLADLSRLIPSSYHKQGQGRIEKTEIIEMAIKHIKMLQKRVDDLGKKVTSGEQTVSSTAPKEGICCTNKFYMGFKEAQDEVIRFLVEIENFTTMDGFCKKIMGHMESASKKFIVDSKTFQDQNLGLEEKHELPSLTSESSGQRGYIKSNSFYQTTSTPTVDDQGLNQDKQLRNLLAEQQHGLGNGQTSGNSSETGSSGMVPMFSYCGHLASSTDPNGMGSSGYVSDISNMEKTSPSGSNSSRDNVYKFKHSITKRFSQEGHHVHHGQHHSQFHHMGHQPSDTSSSTSSRDLEDDQGQLKWKSSKHKPRHASNLPTNSGMYRDDGDTSSGVGLNALNSDEYNTDPVDCSTRKRSNTKYSEPRTQNSVALPGFILHPSGTHYMPISVHNTNISGLFTLDPDCEGTPVFHPISIPVHFRRPVISMPNTTICTHMSSQRWERGQKE